MNPLPLALFLAAPAAPFTAPPAQAPQADQPAQGESVLVTYDLRGILPRWDAGTSWSQCLLVAPLESREHELPQIGDALQYGDVASFELLDLLTQILGDELRREGRELMVEDDALTVLAPPPLHEQVRSILAGLEQALGGSVPLRVDVLTFGPDVELPAPGVVTEEEAARMVADAGARGALQGTQTVELSAGRTARMDAGRSIPYLHDYDVEIAQHMMIFAPIMSRTRDGTRLALRGLAQPGGLSLSVLVQRSELLGEIAQHALDMRGILSPPQGGTTEFLDGPDGVQSPEILLRALAFDSFLPDGKALVLTLEAGLGGRSVREAIVLRRSGGVMSSYVTHAIPRTNRTLIALNAELFRQPHMRVEAPLLYDAGSILPATTAHFDAELSGFLMEWLKVRFSVWRRFGPWILIVTDPAWDRDAGAQLERLVRALQPSTQLALLAVDLRAPGSAQALPVRVRIPLREGSSAGIVLARGTTAVTGYDVEVAQGAAVPDPTVTAVFEGLALSLNVQRSTLQASGLAQLFDTPVAQLELGYVPFGPIARPEPRLLRFDERLTLREPRTGPARIGSGSAQLGLVLELGLVPLR
jgi:hypothetical protein